MHSSAIVKNNPNKYKPSLNEGEPVEFDILKSINRIYEKIKLWQLSAVNETIDYNLNFVLIKQQIKNLTSRS